MCEFPVLSIFGRDFSVRKCGGSRQIYLDVCTYIHAILCGFSILFNFSLGLLGRACLLRDCCFIFVRRRIWKERKSFTLDTFFF